MKAEDFGYVVKNNICLFAKGPLSQWWGGFKDQVGGFTVDTYDFLHHASGKMGNYFAETQYEPLTFGCCEQWMMAKKAAAFDDLDTFKLIMAEKHPSKQKDLGRLVKNFQPDVWDDYKYMAVLSGNLHKFQQNKELQEFLLSFNPHTIFCECVPFDKIWGNGMDINDPMALDINNWQGLNLLGSVIGQVRRIFEYDKELINEYGN
jgi:ribA/ribD-fused uncharacterized protein